MRQPASETAPLFDYYELSLDELEKFPDAIHDIHLGRYHGIIVRGVFDPDAAAEVSRRVEQGEAPIQRISITSKLARYIPTEDEPTPNEADPGFSLGVARMAERDDDWYHAAAAKFRAGCRELFQGLPDFEERITTVLGALAGGRSVQVPAGPDGTTYTPATIRVLPRNLEIGLHVEHFAPLSTARWLSRYAEMRQLSYFVTLQAPEKGGELEVYGLEQADAEGLGAREFAKLLQGSGSMSFKPGSGDLIIFDGSRYYHRVAPSQGPRKRITMGGFLLVSRDDKTIYYWS